MANVETPYDFSFSAYIDYINHVVSMYEIDNENKYTDIHKDIGNRINDKDLYLGVVGSFSSGKSTFINSVIQKNLLPTDAVQGTTVTISILKKSDAEDLEIQYTDGSVKRFSESAAELNERYGITDIKELGNKQKVSLFKRIIDWIKRLFGIRSSDNKRADSLSRSRIELFKKLIATEELATDIKKVILSYKNENIPYRIAMVDTPGTESLNKRHNYVTKSAIDEICDAIVVIIPSDEPASEELINYVNNNLGANKSECIFVVTKIELLGDMNELPRLMRVIKKRLENGLSIESAQVIPMPTLVYLKSVDPEMHMSFLDNIPEDEKSGLIKMYENGLSQIKEILEGRRINYIKQKITDVCERVSNRLKDNLSEVVDNYNEKNRVLTEKAVPTLNTFESLAKRTINNYLDSCLKHIPAEASALTVGFADLRSRADTVLNRCVDSQDIINNMEFSCTEVFADIEKEVNRYLTGICGDFNQKINELRTSFVKEYRICGVDGNASPINIGGSGFFSEEFIGECDELLQNEIDGIKADIRSDTKGVFKRVKSFFSNPVEKHREMAYVRLCRAIEQINQNSVSYIRDEIESRIRTAAKNSELSVKKMTEENRTPIEMYIAKTTRSLSDNEKGKAETQAHIDILNKYIKMIKGAG